MATSLFESKINITNRLIKGWYIDPQTCDDLISFFENNQHLHQVGKTRGPKQGKVSTDISFTPKSFNNFPDCIQKYFSELDLVLTEYKNLYPILDYGIYPWGIFEGFNIQKYKPSEGFLKIHCENSNIETSHRILVFQTYLNTVTDGGETEFPEEGLKIKAEKGLTVLFPAGWTHPHKGCVSSTETKYIITGWFSYDAKQQQTELV